MDTKWTPRKSEGVGFLRILEGLVGFRVFVVWYAPDFEWDGGDEIRGFWVMAWVMEFGAFGPDFCGEARPEFQRVFWWVSSEKMGFWRGFAEFGLRRCQFVRFAMLLQEFLSERRDLFLRLHPAARWSRPGVPRIAQDGQRGQAAVQATYLQLLPESWAVIFHRMPELASGGIGRGRGRLL